MASEALNFDSLVAAIERTHSALAEQASKAVNLSLTLRNWFIGYYIAEFELQGADRASYGDKLLVELSRALRDQSVSNTGRRQLYGYLTFYRTYPQIVRAPSALSAQVVSSFLLEEKVRTLSAQFPDAPTLDAEKLVNRLSYKRRMTNRRKHATQPTAVDAALNDIKTLVVSLNDLQRQMALAYTPIVQGIIQSGSQDVHEIEHALDHLFACAGHPQGLLLFKSLCRYYYGIDPVATARHVHAYKEWYEDAAAAPPALPFESELNSLAQVANVKGLGYGG